MLDNRLGRQKMARCVTPTVISALCLLGGQASAQSLRDPTPPLAPISSNVGIAVAPMAISLPLTAEDLAQSMGIPTANIVSATFGTSEPRAAGIGDSLLGVHFPSEGNTFAILATGFATTADAPNDSPSTSTDLDGPNNSQGYDIVQLSVVVAPPAGATCLAFDAAFYSEEFPEWVNWQYNDTFTAEIGGSDLSIVNDQVVSANNFAFDDDGNPMSINTLAGVLQNTSTTYDGKTPLLRVISPLDASHFPQVELVFTIQDLGDPVYDSAVFLDNFAWLYGANCEPGFIADTDDDGLLDDWEENGIDIDGDGTTDLDLPGMGADRLRKDIFVEVDYMVGADGHSHQPTEAALQVVIDAFANAPVNNPNPDGDPDGPPGPTGINIHIDAGPNSIMNPQTDARWETRSRSDALAHTDALGDFRSANGKDLYIWREGPECVDTTEETRTCFDAIKGVGSTPGHFSVERRDVFHYAIFAHDISLDADKKRTGISRGGLESAQAPASDFIVALGSRSETDHEQAGTFMHELGHNLGLKHGGNSAANFKPNYLSVMNYSFTTRGLRIDLLDGNFDYSRSVAAGLDELHLDETDGIRDLIPLAGTTYYCFRESRFVSVDVAADPIDWNCDEMTQTDAEEDINFGPNDDPPSPLLAGYEDWPHLVYNGGAVGKLGERIELPLETEAIELTIQNIEQLQLPTDYAVAVIGRGIVSTTSGSTEEYQYQVTNEGDNTDTYTLEAVSAQGWADLTGIPANLTLGPDEHFDLSVPVTVPSDAPLGETDTLTIKATSTSNEKIADTVKTTTEVTNQPPIADAGVNQVLECTDTDGATVVLDGRGSSDPHGDVLSYIWTGPFGSRNVSVVTVTIPLGVHTVTLTVDDGNGGKDSDTVELTVQDTTAPSLDVSLSPDMLWPPNHKMRDVDATVTVGDTCNANPAIVLTSVVSSEPDNGKGDGNTVDDIQDADIGTDDRHFKLRAERSGKRDGRVYTVTYTASDESGNEASASATVTVPHSQGKRKMGKRKGQKEKQHRDEEKSGKRRNKDQDV